MDGLHEFNNEERLKVNLTLLDPAKNYCAIAFLIDDHPGAIQYGYNLVDCAGDTEAYRLCIKEFNNTSQHR